MKIEKSAFENNNKIEIKEKFNYSDIEIKDALVNEVTSAEIYAVAEKIGKEDYLIKIEYKPTIKYLDARSLKELTLYFQYEDEVMFSSDFKKAEELEIDYFEESIDLKQLILELIILNLPMNYSVEKPYNFYDESEEVIQKNPFAEIFEKKEE